MSGLRFFLCWTTVLYLAGLPCCQALRRLPEEVPCYNYTLDPDRRLQRNLDVTVNLPTNPEDHLVGDLPLQTAPFPTQHWAGHLKASEKHDKYFFYWLFEPDNGGETVPDDAPLLIWLNGGPACSSMDGLWIENGPLRLTLDDTNHYRVTYDDYSWHKAPAYTLYIDQPVGTGLSFTLSHTYPKNDRQINADFMYFLQEFFTLHSDKFVTNNVVSRPVYFAGESYAGHYIPSMMNYILNNNDASKIQIPLAGAAIGNGWVDPCYQYAGADFAYGYSLIDQAQVDKLGKSETVCQSKLNGGSYNNAICFALIDDIMNNAYGSQSRIKPSSYDIRLDEVKGQAREFPKGHKVLETYLGGHALPNNERGLLDKTIYKQVLQAIHAEASIDAKQQYQECTDPPYMALAGNDGKGVVDDVVSVLNHPDQVRLLFFNGVFDIVCNHVGNERYLEHLPWDKTPQWIVAERYAWMSDSKIAGFMKEYENLLFLKVRDSGHMVPMDVPDIALDMMKLFIYKQSFSSSKQNLPGAAQNDSCPTCPTCKYSRDSGSTPNNSTSGNTSPEQKSSPLGHFVISYAWLVAGVGFCAFVVVMVIMRRPRGPTAVQRATIVPGYEVEMRDNGEYRDVPNGNGKADDDEGRSPII